MFVIVVKNTLFMVLVGARWADLFPACLAAQQPGDPPARLPHHLLHTVHSAGCRHGHGILWARTQYGMINSFLASKGFSVIPFLSRPSFQPSLIVIQCCRRQLDRDLPGCAGCPRTLHEAATVDGANLGALPNITILCVLPFCS